MTEQIRPFDPTERLTKIGAADYLQVAWRLVWFRERHPDASIVSDLHNLTEKAAIFRTTITVPGGGSATGWGSESLADFRDFLEKAETKSIGRALQAMGFGTAAAIDQAPGEPRRPADVPVERPAVTARALAGKPEPPTGALPAANLAAPSNLATEAQLRKLYAAANEHGWQSSEIKKAMTDLWQVGNSKHLDKHQASLLIDLVEGRLQLTYDPDGTARLGQPTGGGGFLPVEVVPWDAEPADAEPVLAKT